MRVLVAYYTLSGYTASLAKAVAAAVQAGVGHDAAPSGSDAPAQDGLDAAAAEVQLLEVVPAKPYSYFTAGIKGVTQAMAGTIVDLASPTPAGESYDALVVLSPTWGWMSSPPVRSFVAGLPEGAGRPAVVGVTHAGGPIGSYDRLAQLVEARGYQVRARLSVFCYDNAAIAAAAAQTAAELGCGAAS